MNDNMSTYKADWREARRRLTDWWDGKKVDRAIAKVRAPIDPPVTARRSRLISDVPGKYTDPDTVFNNLDYNLERTFWGGEAFPLHFVYFGPMFSLAYLGSEPHFTPATTWYKPCYNPE